MEKIVKVLDEIKLGRYKSQNPITFVEVNTSKFLHFIRVERFYWNNDLLCESSQLHEDEGKQFLISRSVTCKVGKKTKGLKYSKYLFTWHGRFQILN